MSKVAQQGTSQTGQPPANGSGAMTRWQRLMTWVEEVASPWATFIKVITDPFTFLLLLAAVLLGSFGPKLIGENGNAVMQVVVAIVTGVAGARVSTVMASIAQEGKLYASGRMAVRGLRLILTKTLALERRVAGFLAMADQQGNPETSAAVALRNLDEVLESIRTLQLEVSGSIENWVDVVPDSDVSQVLEAVGDLREQLMAKESALKAAMDEHERLKAEGNVSTVRLSQAMQRVAEFEREKAKLEGSIGALRSLVEAKVEPAQRSALEAMKAALNNDRSAGKSGAKWFYHRDPSTGELVRGAPFRPVDNDDSK